jgi:hypothetical protein
MKSIVSPPGDAFALTIASRSEPEGGVKPHPSVFVVTVKVAESAKMPMLVVVIIMATDVS